MYLAVAIIIIVASLVRGRVSYQAKDLATYIIYFTFLSGLKTTSCLKTITEIIGLLKILPWHLLIFQVN